MHDSSRTAPGGRDAGLPKMPQVMAASQSPVADAPRAQSPAAPSVQPAPRPISPEDAQHAARQMQQAHAERARRVPAHDGRESVAIPALPPARHAPTRLAPVTLVFVQMLLDIAAIAGAFGFAYWLRFESDIFPRYVPPDVPAYTVMASVLVGTLLVTFYFNRLYNLRRGASRVDEFYKIAVAVTIGTVLALAVNSLILADEFIYSRQILLTGWLLCIVLVASVRLLYSVLVGELRKRGLDRSRVLVVGNGQTAAMVVGRLQHHDTLGYEVVGVMMDSPGAERVPLPEESRIPVWASPSRLAEIIRRRNVDEVIVALQGASPKQIQHILDLIQDETVSIKIYPDAFQLMTQSEVSVGELSGLPLLTVKDVALRGWNRRFKRAFDFVFSLFVLVLTAPLMLLIALAIKLTSPGPIFFIQERVGLDLKPFQLVKFRTMRVDGDESRIPARAEGMPGWTVPNDPRRTAVGKFLRRYSLDELPQFYNVLVGEMSVVGPRPEQPEYVLEFSRRIDKYLRRHREKAGITGWAQVNGLRGDSSIEDRTRADLYYVENWSVLFDLKIIVRTIVTMFKGKNAY